MEIDVFKQSVSHALKGELSECMHGIHTMKIELIGHHMICLDVHMYLDSHYAHQPPSPSAVPEPASAFVL